MMTFALATAENSAAEWVEDLRDEIFLEESEFERLWPKGPISVDAYDIRDLDDPCALELINCLLELTVERGLNHLVVLNTEDLLMGDDRASIVDRYATVKQAFQVACRIIGVCKPQLRLERSAGGLDLHVLLRRRAPHVGSLLSFEAERRRRSLAAAR